jgi:CNT family concentrative nucleoside transporter
MFCVMTVGMAGVAGTILAAYAAMGIRVDYLVAAAFMSAPGGVLMAKLMMPDVPPPQHAHDDTPLPNPHVAVSAPDEERPANLIMAASQGAQTGVRLAVAVGAMVLAFVALVAMANGILGGIGGRLGYPDLSFQQILGTVFAPVFLLLGAPTWAEAAQAGGLFGTKIVLNEFVAFIDLGTAKHLSQHTVAIVTFALCGFANFSSIALQPFAQMAGSASSVQAFLRMVIGSGVGMVIGLAYDGTARPLALAFLGCGLAALALVLWSEHGRLFRRVNPRGTLREVPLPDTHC